MGASSARAERMRRRLPRRMRRRDAVARAVGVGGTAAVLATGVAVALKVAPEGDSGGAAVTASSPARPAAPARAPAPPRKPRRPRVTPAQRRQLRAALAMVRLEGYEVVRRADYDFRATLRVLLAHRIGADTGPRVAFFFVGRRYLGHDADTPSASLSVGHQGKRYVALRYGICCPAGRRLVRFHWNGTVLVMDDPLPPAPARATPAG